MMNFVSVSPDCGQQLPEIRAKVEEMDTRITALESAVGDLFFRISGVVREPDESLGSPALRHSATAKTALGAELNRLIERLSKLADQVEFVTKRVEL